MIITFRGYGRLLLLLLAVALVFVLVCIGGCVAKEREELESYRCAASSAAYESQE